MDLHRDEAVAPACEEFKKIHDRLAAAGGGLISIFYHPCEWVHREFWDGVNFRRGANPPREQWKAPPQRPKEETEAAFQRFERYIDFQRSLPGVKFVDRNPTSRTSIPTASARRALESRPRGR
jgi:hypothetical protein